MFIRLKSVSPSFGICDDGSSHKDSS